MPHSTQRTRTATISFIPSGLTVIRISPEAIQSLEDAKQNIATAVQIGAPERRPLLVDIRGCHPLEASVRHFYSGQILIDSFRALCMVVDMNPLGKMMGNLYLRVAKPGIPTHLSTDEAEAHRWLHEFVVPRK